MNIVFFNGNYTDISQAFLPIMDLGVIRGYSVFDFMRTYNGKVFIYDKHMDRFENGIKELGLKMPYSREELLNIIHTLKQKNGMVDCNIRIVLTGGVSSNLTDFDNSNFFVTTEPIDAKVQDKYDNIKSNGGSLLSTQFVRPYFSIKHIDYIEYVKHQKLLKEKGMIEVLYNDGNCILECGTSNILMFKGNTLILPNNNILYGTTRNFIVEISKNDFNVEERDILLNELDENCELFITATNKEILPIISIEGNINWKGKVGENTKKLMKIFDEKKLEDKYLS